MVLFTPGMCAILTWKLKRAAVRNSASFIKCGERALPDRQMYTIVTMEKEPLSGPEVTPGFAGCEDGKQLFPIDEVGGQVGRPAHLERVAIPVRSKRNF